MVTKMRWTLMVALVAAVAACSSDDGGDGGGGSADTMAGDMASGDGGGSEDGAGGTEDGSGGMEDVSGGGEDAAGGEDTISVSDALVCLQDNCGTELDACNGDADCKAFIDCVTSCDDFACTDKCVEPDSDPGLSLLEGVGLCGDVNDCLPEGSETPADIVDCVDEACTDEAAACASDTFCSDTRSCIAGCEDGDCVDTMCLPDDATPTAAFNAWIACGDIEGCLPDDGEEDDCVFDECGSEILACFNEQACADAIDCLDACDESSEDGCELACISSLSGDAETAFDAIFDCATTKCPDGGDGGGDGGGGGGDGG